MNRVILITLVLTLIQGIVICVYGEEEFRYGLYDSRTSTQPVYNGDEDDHFQLTTKADEFYVNGQDVFDGPPTTTEYDFEDHTPPEHQSIGTIERVLKQILKRKKK